MDCGKDNAIDWAKENARYKDIIRQIIGHIICSAEMAEHIGHFLDDNDDDSDEDIEG